MDFLMQKQNLIVAEMKINDYLKDNIIYLTDEIDEDCEIEVCHKLRKLAERQIKEYGQPKEPLRIFISSYGGNVYQALGIISEMIRLQEQGFQIDTYCKAMAFSGAFMILIFGSNRYCSKYGRVMMHQVSTGNYKYCTGQELSEDAEDVMILWDKLKEMIIEKTKLTKEELILITKEKRDMYMWAEEALQKGVIDYIE